MASTRRNINNRSGLVLRDFYTRIEVTTNEYNQLDFSPLSIFKPPKKELAAIVIAALKRQRELTLTNSEQAIPVEPQPKGIYVVLKKPVPENAIPKHIRYQKAHIEALAPNDIAVCFADTHTSRVYLKLFSTKNTAEFMENLHEVYSHQLQALTPSRIPKTAVNIIEELGNENILQKTPTEFITYCWLKLYELVNTLEAQYKSTQLSKDRIDQLYSFANFIYQLQYSIQQLTIRFKIETTQMPRVGLFQPEYSKIDLATIFAEAEEKSLTLIPTTNRNTVGALIEDINLDIRKRPQSHGLLLDNADCLAIGDLHANVIKLLVFLIRENIITNLSSNDYKNLKKIYSSLTNDEVEPDFAAISATFNRIQERIQMVNPASSPKIILIGDDVADEEGDDYLTLTIYKKLRTLNLNLRILLSNHNRQLIITNEVGELAEIETVPWQTKPVNSLLNPIHSINRLANHIRHGELAASHVIYLIEAHYYKTLVAMDYSINEAEKIFTFYTHAEVGWSIVPYILKDLKLTPNQTYPENSPYAIAANIDLINTRIQTLLANKQLRHIWISGSALYDLVWHRKSDKKTIPYTRSHDVISDGWRGKYIFGHAIKSKTDDINEKVNLNNEFGCKEKPIANYLCYYSGNKLGFIQERKQRVSNMSIFSQKKIANTETPADHLDSERAVKAPAT